MGLLKLLKRVASRIAGALSVETDTIYCSVLIKGLDEKKFTEWLEGDAACVENTRHSTDLKAFTANGIIFGTVQPTAVTVYIMRTGDVEGLSGIVIPRNT